MLSLLLLIGPPLPTALQALDGQWVSPCLAMGKNGRHGSIVRLTIVGKRVEAVAQTYAHATCDVPTVETRFTATLDRVKIRGGAIHTALTVDDVTMTPEHPEVVAIWNQDRAAKGCGDHDWRLGDTQSVAGKPCAPGVTFPKRGAHLPATVAFDGDTLLLPSPLAGATAGGDHAGVTLKRADQ